MIENIFHKKELYGLIIRSEFRKKTGINFFTDDKATQQFGYMKHKKNYLIKPHLHKPRKNQISTTSEVIILFKGILRVDFYDYKEKYLMSKKIFANDIIMLVNGAHGFKVLKNVEMLEVKQGPYNIKQDKFKFNKVDEDKILLK
tara:strand:+ start:295 stop:726 length:432 start_codon:yes stop_codon:yes gene_type:complete